MTDISAVAFVPSAPLLVPQVAGGSAAIDEELRDACRDALRTVLSSEVDGVLVLSAWSTGASWPADATWSFDGFGVAARVDREARLPWPLGIGAWLLDDVGWNGQRGYLTVGPDGETHAEVGLERVAVLVIGDGSARRSDKAPGHLDERADAFDADIAKALAAGDVAALGALDPMLSDDLLCAGAPAWRWLASAIGSRPVTEAELLSDTAPYGVGYFVAWWRLSDRDAAIRR